MRKVYKVGLLLIFMFVVSILLQRGCESLMLKSGDKMTKDEIGQYYQKNKTVLSHIVSTCEKYPQIRRVEKDEIMYYKDSNVSKYASLAAKDIQENIKKIHIDNVQCARNEQIINNDLMAISFWLYSAGLGVSGEGQFIEYETKQYRDEMKKRKKVDIPWQTAYPLPDEGWSIVFTK